MSHVKTNMKGLVKKNAWYAGWFATMAAAGWAIDELTGQVVSKKPDLVMGFYWRDDFYGVLGDTYKDVCKLLWPTGIIRYSNVTQTSASCTALLPNGTQPGTNLTRIACPPYNPALPSSCNTSVQPQPTPVPDSALYESLAAEMLKDPKAAAQAFMVPDAWPYPYPHIFPDPVKYIPGVSEADEALLDSLIKGQLQTTNPNAANYVTPEKLQQLQQLLSQLQQGITPEGGVGSANDALKNPLTQAQLEETLKKEKAAEEKAIKDALGEKPSFDKLTEPLDKFVENVNKTPQDEINPLPQNTFGIAGSGTCYLIQKPISIMGVTVDMSTRSFCEAYYYPYFLPILTWFFYIATGLYIWFSLRDAYSRRI